MAALQAEREIGGRATYWDKHFHDELQSGVGLFRQNCNRMLQRIYGKKRRTRMSEGGSP